MSRPPAQNEPRSECGWEVLRWGYEKCRAHVLAKKPDVFLVHSPHWTTVVGTHLLDVPRFSGLSVDPIFPNLFRYHYDLRVDTELAEAIHDEGKAAGLEMSLMKNPQFRVDYGTITSCHLMNPAWDVPIVGMSANNSPYYFSNEVGMAHMVQLGQATKRAIDKLGRRAVLLASNSLSHRHFTTEPELPEDMSGEHVYRHGQYLWDMEVIRLMRDGKTRELAAILPEFFDHAESETKSGALMWMLSALDFPDYPAVVHAYGNVIGTGNAIVEWDHEYYTTGVDTGEWALSARPQPDPDRIQRYQTQAAE